LEKADFTGEFAQKKATGRPLRPACNFPGIEASRRGQAADGVAAIPIEREVTANFGAFAGLPRTPAPLFFYLHFFGDDLQLSRRWCSIPHVTLFIPSLAHQQ
jgi:hypothetical protein